MLENLSIQNVALIERCHISFGDGLNILTGETGAGKSMVLGSLAFVLGARVSPDFLRKDAKMAKVEASFSISDKETLLSLEASGIEVDEETLIISRTLNDAHKSVCRINGTMVNLTMLRELSKNFIDIYGQHEYQSLLNSQKHILLLDRFCGDELSTLLESYAASYRTVKSLKKEMNDLVGDENEREQRIDILTFQSREIAEANLVIGEDETLQKQKKRLAHSEKLTRCFSEILNSLYEGGNEGNSAYDNMGIALHNLREAENLDENLLGFADDLEDIYVKLEDVARELRRYQDTIEEAPDELEDIEDRLALIQKLKKKYGNSLEEILLFHEKIEKELDKLSRAEIVLDEIAKKIEEEEKICNAKAEKLTALRRKMAKSVEQQVEVSLQDMEMVHGKFRISITPFDGDILGQDKVEFLFSANLGETIKPLSKIASGGEMSRVMLALKSVLVDADEIETFVFDEIDTGISGRTAGKVGEKMNGLAKKRQIICITHLPQIAAMSDHHFLIEKSTIDDMTKTSVVKLEDKDALLEVARLIGSTKITTTTLAAAKELRKEK